MVPILVLLLCKRDNTENETQIKYNGRDVVFFTMYSDDDFLWLCAMIFLKQNCCKSCSASWGEEF